MIKYYKELETPNDCVLHLIKNAISRSSFMYISRSTFPDSFFERHTFALSNMAGMERLIKLTNIENMIKDFELRNRGKFDSQKEMDEWMYAGETRVFFDRLKNGVDYFDEPLDDLDDRISNPSNMRILLSRYLEILASYMHYSADIEKNWRSTYAAFKLAVRELDKYSYFEHGIKENKVIDLKMPNAWYITSLGDLYNVGEKGGHKEANLVYPLQDVNRAINNGQKFDGTVNSLIRERNEILQRGYIDSLQYQNYLNYKYDFPNVPINEEEFKKFPVAYERVLVKRIVGIISAQIGFYRFFSNLQKYTNNPSNELCKLMDMTNGEISDILVRCSGFYKVESNLDKTITTSSIAPFAELSEYVSRGWDVAIIPPIIIDRSKGELNELDFEKPILSKVLEKDIKKYNNNKQSNYGRIYYRKRSN